MENQIGSGQIRWEAILDKSVFSSICCYFCVFWANVCVPDSRLIFACIENLALFLNCSTKSTIEAVTTKLFEKARVASLSSTTSPHYADLIRAEAEAAENAKKRRRNSSRSKK